MNTKLYEIQCLNWRRFKVFFQVYSVIITYLQCRRRCKITAPPRDEGTWPFRRCRSNNIIPVLYRLYTRRGTTELLKLDKTIKPSNVGKQWFVHEYRETKPLSRWTSTANEEASQEIGYLRQLIKPSLSQSRKLFRTRACVMLIINEPSSTSKPSNLLTIGQVALDRIIRKRK